MPNESTPPPEPGQQTQAMPVLPLKDAFDFYWKTTHDAVEDAKREIRNQLLIYVTTASFVVAALGFLGYRLSVNEAIDRVSASLSEEVKKRIIEKAVSDPAVMRAVEKSIVANEQKTFENQVKTLQEQYVKIGDYYLIKSDLGSSPFLDIVGLPPKFEVSANTNSDRHWMLKTQK